jgi:hypothetical protein
MMANNGTRETTCIELSRSLAEEFAETLRYFLDQRIILQGKHKNSACLNKRDREGVRLLGILVAQGIELQELTADLKQLIQYVRWLKNPSEPCEVYVLATREDALAIAIGLQHTFALSVLTLLPTKGKHEKLLVFGLDLEKHPYEEILEWLQAYNLLACAVRILLPGETPELAMLKKEGFTELKEDSVEYAYPAWRNASEIDVLGLSSIYALSTEAIIELIAALSVQGKHVTNGAIEDEIVGVDRERRGY